MVSSCAAKIPKTPNSILLGRGRDWENEHASMWGYEDTRALTGGLPDKVPKSCGDIANAALFSCFNSVAGNVKKLKGVKNPA